MTKVIVIIDGTLSRLDNGFETHAGKLFKLSLRLPPRSRRVFYDSGVQGSGWKKWWQVATGEGLNRSVLKTYLKLAQHYQKGDQLYLFGYSRGAYAVRMLAGMIDQIGLLEASEANFANAERVLQLYQERAGAEVRRGSGLKFRAPVEIDFLGVWDTVKALGFRVPYFGGLTPKRVDFRDLRVPRNVKRACQALAMDETRVMFRPEIWREKAAETVLAQRLFRGDHAVVGGHIESNQEARLVGNFSFLWMLGEARVAGFELVGDWRTGFPTDVCAPIFDGREWFDWIWKRRRREFLPAEFFVEDESVQARREQCGELGANN